jgi:hypothetical protein
MIRLAPDLWDRMLDYASTMDDIQTLIAFNRTGLGTARDHLRTAAEQAADALSRIADAQYRLGRDRDLTACEPLQFEQGLGSASLVRAYVLLTRFRDDPELHAAITTIDPTLTEQIDRALEAP